MTILDTIAAHAKTRVEAAKEIFPAESIRRAALSLPADDTFPFEAALARTGMSFICECKKASPSKGLIAPDFPYLSIAKDYEDAGASCISVLTEPKWFLGQNLYLEEIAHTVTIPCLRKDFTVDDYMIYQAKLFGASAVLIIAAITPEETIRSWISLCDRLGLSALVEAHDAEEIRTALRAGARILGVNNRNLKDFTVDIHNSMNLRRSVPRDVLFVAESGIRTRTEIVEMEAGGVDAVLIGETLMRSENKRAMLAELGGFA